MQITVSQPDQAVLNRSAEAMLEVARTLVIDSDEMYQIAADELQSIKKKAKDFETQRTSLVAPLNEVVKKLNDLFRPPADYLAQAETFIKRAMLNYQEERERKRRAEEARLRAEAEERAAKERARIAQEAAAAEERNRIEQDRLAKERAAALEAGDTVKAAKIEAKAEGIAEAAEAKQESLTDIAATIQAAPVAVMPELARVKGISTRTKWEATVVDMPAFLAAVAANPQYLQLVLVNEKALNQMATALKNNLAIPGVKVEEKTLMAARAA